MTPECHVRICGSLGGRFPGATRPSLTSAALEKKVWSTILLGRVHEEIKLTRVVGSFPNATAITRLMGAML